MQNNVLKSYDVLLVSQPSNTFRCIKAANSTDLDIQKKLTHTLHIEADLETPFNVGLIVGSSGSGKTTLARQIFGDCFRDVLDKSLPIIEQFPKEMTFDECAAALGGAGLASVTCWIRPAATLSNGQQARAEIALRLASDDELIVIDEFTSVVDRTVAKAMAHTVQKLARRTGKRVVLLSCHYDVIEWLNPCWIIDCNRAEYIDRRAFFLTTNEANHSPSTSQNVTARRGAILASITI